MIIESFYLKRYTLALKILLTFFAALALMIILLAWRLSIGPVALDWAGDYLKEALSGGVDDASVDFRDAVLIWHAGDVRAHDRSSGLQVIFYDVKIVNHKTDFALNLPRAGVRFSGLAMLRGLLAPTDVEISGLSINYTLGPEAWDSTDNRPVIERLEALLANFKKSDSLLFEMAQQLLSPPESSLAAGYLHQISLPETTITLTDQLSGQKWQIPEAYLDLRRTDAGLNIDLSGDINMASTHIMPIDFFILYNNREKEAVTVIKFSDLRLSALAGKVKALSGLAKMDIPARGNIKFTVNSDFDIPVMAFSLSLAKGSINPANIYAKPLKITSAALDGHILRKRNSIILDEISLQLGQTFISGSGMLYGTMDRPGIAINADIRDLPFLDLKSYWPGQLGKGAYQWINKNIDAGIVPEGKLAVYIKPEMWPQDNEGSSQVGLPADAVSFKFAFNNIKAHYLRPMPILSDMSGHAELDLHSFHMQATSGKIRQLVLKKADLLFSDIHLKGKALANINLELEGSVDEILRVIDHKPLGFPTRYGIKEGSITGQANAIVSLQFPLLKKVRLKDVIYEITADISSLSIPELTRTLAIDDGQMVMHVDDKGITAEGKITLNGVQFNSKWLENFDKSQQLPTRYSLNGIIEGAAWEQLHLPFDPYIDGPVEINLELSGKGGTLVRGRGQFDLMNSKSSFAPLGWEKAKGKAGLVGFDLEFNGPGRLNIRNISLHSDSLEADLEIDMVDDLVTRFFVPKLVMKNTDLIMLMEWNDKKKYYLSSLTGKTFDAAPLIKILTATGGDDEKVDLPDFNLDAEIQSMLTNNNVRIKDVKISAIYRDQDFTHVTLDGTLGADKKISVTISPNGDKRKLEFTSNDAGEALRGLGMFNLGVGGDMTLSADMVRHEFGLSLGGKARAKKFKVIDSPGFSKLLAEKKFAKARKELEKGGVSFDQFEMDFRIYNGVMEITKGRARGSSLGIIIEGTVDQVYNEMNISGTITPAYGLNSLLGHIPLIGTILTGGKGQGIFAAKYNISGPPDNPDVKINKISALAPGIFRNIFSVFGSGKKKTLREKAEKKQSLKEKDTPPSTGQDNKPEN